MADRNVRPPIHPFRYARNGKYPDALYTAQLATVAGHLTAFRMKEVASFGMTTVLLTTPGIAGRVRWRARFRTSPYVERIACYALMAPCSADPASTGSFARVEFDDGTIRGIAKLPFGESYETDIPNDTGLSVTLARDSATPTQEWVPTADTVYNVTVTDINSRIVALSIWEGSATGAGVHDAGYAAGVPILDSQRENLITSARLMWKQQAAQLFTWTVDNQASPRTRISGTACNLIDNSTTTVTTATPGYTIDLRNRSTVSRGTVPCVFEAYGKTENALGSGAVELRDSSGSVLASVAFTSTTASWQSDTVDLPATLAKYDLYFKGDATWTCSAYAATLRQYASGT